MTPRERVTAAFGHREPDRTPYFEYVLLSPLADHFLGRPYAVDDGNFRRLEAERGFAAAVRQTAVDRVDLAERLGHDLIYAWPCWPAAPAAATPAPVTPPPPEDPVERLRQRNAARAATPPQVSDAELLVFVSLKEELRRRDLDLPLLAPAYAHGVWTDTDLLQTMALAPDVAHAHYALATRDVLPRVERYLELGIELIGVGGDFAGNRPLISPAAYRAFIMPEVRTEARRVHAGGAWVVNASDGNLWSVLDDFLVGTEVDGYLEIDAHAGMDLGRLKRGYGQRLTFLGNMDCGNVLSFASPESVAAETVACLRAGQGAGGHIFSASNAITASVPLANYLAMVNSYRGHFGLPPLRP